MTTETKNLLPSKLSDLIVLAVKDGLSLDRTLYFPEYSNWHDPQHSGVCEVCFAGAVMAGTLALDVDCSGNPMAFGHLDGILLTALDKARRGDWHVALVMCDRATQHPHGRTADLSFRDLDTMMLQRLHALIDDTAQFSDWDAFDEFLERMEYASNILREYGF